MSDRQDLWTAIKARERNRSWVRGATLVVGAGALATAGVVAYTLPGPPQHPSAATTAPGSGSPAQQATRGYGDDGGGDDGAAPAPASSQTPVHATTGGS